MRFRSLGAVLGISLTVVLGGVGPSAAEAAQFGWGAYPGQVKRPVFRPMGAPTRQAAPALRWRPHAGEPAGRALSGTGRGYPYSGQPLTRRLGSETPLFAPAPSPATAIPPDDRRFRPSAGGRFGAAATDDAVAPGASGVSRGLQAQFRPPREARRLSYEQLQASQRQDWRQAAGGALARRPVAAGGYRHPWAAW